MTTFARGFRLHLPHGQVLDGAELPNGRAFVMDDPMWGLGSTARTVDLLKAGYPNARIERSTETQVTAERDCLAMAVMFALQWTPDAPMSLRDGIEEILATMPATPAEHEEGDGG